jgi:hypothetical protein
MRRRKPPLKKGPKRKPESLQPIKARPSIKRPPNRRKKAVPKEKANRKAQRAAKPRKAKRRRAVRRKVLTVRAMKSPRAKGRRRLPRNLLTISVRSAKALDCPGERQCESRLRECRWGVCIFSCPAALKSGPIYAPWNIQSYRSLRGRILLIGDSRHFVPSYHQNVPPGRLPARAILPNVSSQVPVASAGVSLDTQKA